MSIRKIGLGLIISAVSLYFVLRNVQWGQVWDHLRQVNPAIFVVSMLLMLLAYFLMAWRWQRLLEPLETSTTNDQPSGRRAGIGEQGLAGGRPSPVRGAESIFSLYGKILTGYFFNVIFPARAGDFVRAYLLGRTTGLRKTTVLATIVIEKAFDGMALLLMLLVALVLLPSTTAFSSSGLEPGVLAWVAALALAGTVAGLVLFYVHSYRLARFVEGLASRFPLPDRVRRLAVRLIETFAQGMGVFKSPRPLISAALISAGVWIVVALMFLAAFYSFKAPFPQELTGIPGLLFITGLVNLGLLVPALPGNLGTYEALCVAAMTIFRVDKELAVAFALVFHAGQLLTTLLIGLLALWMQNLTLSELRPVERQAEQEAETALEEANPSVDVI